MNRHPEFDVSNIQTPIFWLFACGVGINWASFAYGARSHALSRTRPLHAAGWGKRMDSSSTWVSYDKLRWGGRGRRRLQRVLQQGDDVLGGVHAGAALDQ